MTRTPTVYVLSEPRPNKFTGDMPNTLALMQFGRVKYLIPRGVTPEFDLGSASVMLDAGLKEFDPSLDYVTTVGGSYLGAMMLGWILRDLGHSNFMFLRFERERMPDDSRNPTSGNYWPVLVDFNTLLPLKKTETTS